MAVSVRGGRVGVSAYCEGFRVPELDQQQTCLGAAQQADCVGVVDRREDGFWGGRGGAGFGWCWRC